MDASVHTFPARDGTRLAYRLIGAPTGAEPVVCLGGGPMLDPAYLGDLGGLAAHRTLAVLDPRGVANSAVPQDAATYRCDRQVDDVEALRGHLGLDAIDLLGHSAGANLAVRYVERFPGRVRRLALVTPSTRAVGIEITGEMRRAVGRSRRAEPWFPAAYAALERATTGHGTEADWDAVEPFFHGRWDAEIRAHCAARNAHRNRELAEASVAEGAFAPEVTRSSLRDFAAPVLLLTGALDVNSPPPAMAEYAGLLPTVAYVELPGAAHFPWLDDAAAFVEPLATFFG
jgi:proline iminopeptidase